MSIEAMRHVWKQSAQRGSALVVMLAIADMANDDGDCWPGIPRLAQKCRLTERPLQMILRRLVASGELRIMINEGVKTATGWTNRYRVTGVIATTPLDSEAVIARSPLPAPSGDQQDTSGVIVVTPLPEQAVITVTPLDVEEVIGRSPDPSLNTDPSVTTDPPSDPSAAAESGDSARVPAHDPAPVAVAADDWATIQPEVDKLLLGPGALPELRAQGPAYALAVAWQVGQRKGVLNPGGLAVSILRDGGPSEVLLRVAEIGIARGITDFQEADAYARRLELADLQDQAQAQAEPESAEMEVDPPEAAPVETAEPSTPLAAPEPPSESPASADDHREQRSYPPAPAASAPDPGEAAPPAETGLETLIVGNLTARDVWTAAMGQLQAQLNPSTYVSWIVGAEAIAYADGALTIRARVPAARLMLCGRLHEAAQGAVTKVAERDLQLVVCETTAYDLEQAAGC